MQSGRGEVQGKKNKCERKGKRIWCGEKGQKKNAK